MMINFRMYLYCGRYTPQYLHSEIYNDIFKVKHTSNVSNYYIKYYKKGPSQFYNDNSYREILLNQKNTLVLLAPPITKGYPLTNIVSGYMQVNTQYQTCSLRILRILIKYYRVITVNKN